MSRDSQELNLMVGRMYNNAGVGIIVEKRRS